MLHLSATLTLGSLCAAALPPAVLLLVIAYNWALVLALVLLMM